MVTVGIIGAGRIGKVHTQSICNYIRSARIKTVADPFMNEATEKWLLSMGVEGTTKDYGMANDEFFSMMRPGAIFINASRGEVVDEAALKRAIPKLGPVIIDTWNNEPNIDLELLNMVDIATPHIAGYSYQGKQNGTMMAVRALARFFGIEPLYDFFPKTEIIDLESIRLDLKGKSQGEVASVLQYNYPIFTDDFIFRMAPETFESLRSNYQYRREFYIF